MDERALVKLAERYADHVGLKLATVSTYAANAGAFFPDLKAGKGCTLRKAGRVVRWFDENWPDGLDWPADIPRPSSPKDQKVA